MNPLQVRLCCDVMISCCSPLPFTLIIPLSGARTFDETGFWCWTDQTTIGISVYISCFGLWKLISIGERVNGGVLAASWLLLTCLLLWFLQ